jgi:hypothetical protein
MPQGFAIHEMPFSAADIAVLIVPPGPRRHFAGAMMSGYG